MSFCDYCVQWFISYLERDIEAHEAGRIWDVGEAFEDAPEWRLCGNETTEHRLGLAETFWENWMDSRDHGWAFYRGMDEGDWPVVARQIARGLREEWEPERLMENAVFDPPP